MLGRLERGLIRLEEAAAGLLLLAMTALAFLEVVLRGVFHLGLPWSGVLLRQGVLWIAMLGASLAASQRRHIRIDLLLRPLPPRWIRRVSLAVDALASAVCLLLAAVAWRFVAAEREFGTFLYLNWPAWPFQLILPAGFGLLSLKFGLRVAEDAFSRKLPEPPPPL